MIKHIFFDLDGTLLPMPSQEAFIKSYMKLLTKEYIDAGLITDAKAFAGAIWKAFEAMIKNDGKRSNCDVFWDIMQDILSIDVPEAKRISDIFYEGNFNLLKSETTPTPLSGEVIAAAREKNIHVYLMTNPVFPRAATLSRVKWAGLREQDFEIITTYENSYFCKPNVEYYRTVLSKYDIEPCECMMAGNDVSDDLSARQLGVETFLVEDNLENNYNLPIVTEHQGMLSDLLAFIKALPQVG